MILCTLSSNHRSTKYPKDFGRKQHVFLLDSQTKHKTYLTFPSSWDIFLSACYKRWNFFNILFFWLRVKNRISNESTSFRCPFNWTCCQIYRQGWHEGFGEDWCPRVIYCHKKTATMWLCSSNWLQMCAFASANMMSQHYAVPCWLTGNYLTTVIDSAIHMAWQFWPCDWWIWWADGGGWSLSCLAMINMSHDFKTGSKTARIFSWGLNLKRLSFRSMRHNQYLFSIFNIICYKKYIQGSIIDQSWRPWALGFVWAPRVTPRICWTFRRLMCLSPVRFDGTKVMMRNGLIWWVESCWCSVVWEH